MLKTKRLKIGIVGCGAIGTGVALFVDKELKKPASLTALADLDIKIAKRLQKKLHLSPKVLPTDTLIKNVDLVIEAAGAKAAEVILKKAILYRKDVIILSVGALINDPSILQKIKQRGIKLYVPSGAICGVDGLGSLSMGRIRSVKLITSKHPRGFLGSEYLKLKKIDLSNLKQEKIIFKGSVKQAVKYFPKNINVAAILLLASGVRDVQVCIKANPKLKKNTHRIEVDSPQACLSINVENTPSKLNPKTSALAILSTQYLLRNIFSNFRIGS